MSAPPVYRAFGFTHKCAAFTLFFLSFYGAWNTTLRTSSSGFTLPTRTGELIQSSLKWNNSLLREYRALSTSFHEKGGVVVFRHIQKTAGSAIRAYLTEKIPDKNTYIGSYSNFADFKARIAQYCVQGTPLATVLFAEIHGEWERDSMHALREWKFLARQHRTPFFAFSMVREPVSWYLSFFNYNLVHHGGLRPAEETFFESVTPNLQCAEWAGLDWRAKQAISERSCLSAIKDVVEVFDFVFTSDQIEAQVLPIISHLGKIELQRICVIQPEDLVQAGGFPQTLRVQNISTDGLVRLQNITNLDLHLYNTVKRTFKFDAWRKYLAEANALEPAPGTTTFCT